MSALPGAPPPSTESWDNYRLLVIKSIDNLTIEVKALHTMLWGVLTGMLLALIVGFINLIMIIVSKKS